MTVHNNSCQLTRRTLSSYPSEWNVCKHSQIWHLHACMLEDCSPCSSTCACCGAVCRAGLCNLEWAPSLQCHHGWHHAGCLLANNTPHLQKPQNADQVIVKLLVYPMLVAVARTSFVGYKSVCMMHLLALTASLTFISCVCQIPTCKGNAATCTPQRALQEQGK